MTSEVIDYNKAFDNYYKDKDIELRLHSILKDYLTSEYKVELLKALLNEVYYSGVHTTAQDSLDTIRQYATTLAGLPARVVAPEEMYDAVALNLMVYFTKALDNFDKEQV